MLMPKFCVYCGTELPEGVSGQCNLCANSWARRRLWRRGKLEPRKAISSFVQRVPSTRIVRVVGAVVVFVSVFLTWLTGLTSAFVEGRITLIRVDLSLGQMAGSALEGLGRGAPLEAFAFIFITAILVVVGGIISFRHSLGGIPVLAGVGYFFFYINAQEVFAQLEAEIGIGPYIAVAGAAIVIFAFAIPRLSILLRSKRAVAILRPRKKLVAIVLAVVIVAATGYVLFLNFTQNQDDGAPVIHDVTVPGGTPANVGNGTATSLPLGGATSFQVLANITEVQQLVDVQIRIEVGGSEHQTGRMAFTGSGAAWTFTVTSVEAGRAYTLTIEALDRVGHRSTFEFIVATS